MKNDAIHAAIELEFDDQEFEFDYDDATEL